MSHELEPRLYVVLCRRIDGTERPWQFYASPDEADRAAKALANVGCPARVSGPDEPVPLKG